MTTTIREFWGTYPPAGLGTPPGHGEGVFLRRAGRRPVKSVPLPAPSFLAMHPTLPVLYAVTETEPSELVAFDVSDDVPSEIGRIGSSGAFACHVTIAPDGTQAYVAHYGTGEVSCIGLGADGAPASLQSSHVDDESPLGPRGDRQDGPHAHFTVIEPVTGVLLACDLGTDTVRRYLPGPDGLEFDGTAVRLPAGSGPRHLVCAGDMLYVACELSNEVATVRWDRLTAQGEVIDMAPTTTVAPRSEDESAPSHIAIVDGVLIVGVRGADVLAVHDLSPEGALRYRGALSSGHWPRHFAAVGDELVIAAERGHEVRRHALADVLGMEPERGLGEPSELPVTADQVPSPACILRG